MSIQVLIADDHSIIREGLRMLFVRHPQIEVVGEAADGEQAVALADQLSPDVVVMDITMPQMDGPTATAEIIARHPQVKVIALSMHTEQYFIDKMTAAGATGYVAKEEAWEELVTAIETVARGESHFPERVHA